MLLVVIDDLRADHLPFHGYDRDTAPHLTRRVSDGILFTKCHSPVGWTLPACASIITGQLPDDHGLIDHNCKFRKPKIGHYLGESYYRLGIANNGNVVTDSIPRETLERLGFKRRPAKWRFFGWDEGFDRYQWTPREDHLTPFRRARDFLDDPEAHAGDKPWFLFFHTNVVHDYHMDREYYMEVQDWIGEDIHPGLRGVRDGPEIWRTPPPGVDRAMQKRHLVAKYDSGIRFMDRELEGILQRVNYDDTIVVFISDHGEGFEPELGRVHHCGRMHEDLIHVPLVVWLPPELRENIDASPTVTRFSSTIDVVPTLLTLLGDAVAGFPGENLFDLPVHRRLAGVDRGYIYWEEDCVRESYDTCRIDIRSDFTYPLKQISVTRNDTTREYAYHLGYDPDERHNLLEPLPPAIENFEPITFVVVVNDADELQHNLLNSPVARSRDHEWLVIENTGNKAHKNISSLYNDGLKRAKNDLVYFFHQDVYLPHGWEERMFASLAELEARDPNWGVLGAVGATPRVPGEQKILRGHWCDPSGYYREGPLPHAVQALDEQWLGVRRSRGVTFDSDLPGFHCYGLDICMSARDQGLESYALDAFVWHKFHDRRGYLVGCRDDSDKIQRRRSEEFRAEFQPATEYVRDKWKKYLPFHSTSYNWDAD